MEQETRIKDGFPWKPMDQRTDKIGFPLPHRKKEDRKPLLWLVRDQNSLYLVNITGGLIDLVRFSSASSLTVDDNNVENYEDQEGRYYDIGDNESVLIKKYDGFYDLDYMHQIDFILQSSVLGKIKLTTLPEKGPINEMVLLWDSWEFGGNMEILA